jgi:chemotaxis protein methyltransferase CheR
VKPQDFELIANIARQRSGLTLTPDKAYLLDSRLSPIARKEGMAGLEELIGAIRMRRDERLIALVVDALTTNETFFFRDKTPFDLLRDRMLPHFARTRPAGGRLRIWCAAASTGQEPYSIAMTVEEQRAAGRAPDAEILGTDISERVLERARAGLYTQFEVQRGLPITHLVRYFDKADDQWRIQEPMRRAIRFQKHNLLEDFRSFGRFDIIYCRNVLIYFDQPTKKQVLERMASQLMDDGFLVLGAAETVLGLTEMFRPAADARGLYVRATASTATTTTRAVA